MTYFARFAILTYLFCALSVSAEAQSVAKLQEQCNSRRGDIAIEACTKLIDGPNSPERSDYYANRAMALWRRGKELGAQDLCDGSIADFTMAIELRRASNKTYGGTLANRANAWKNCKGDLAKALKDYEAAVPHYPKEHIAGLHNSIADTLQRLGKVNEAKAAYDRGLASNPSSLNRAFLLANRGTLWMETAELDKAITDLDAAVHFKPTTKIENSYWAAWLVVRAEVWRRKGDLQRALVDIERAIQADPDAPIHVTRGDILRYSGQFDRALVDYDRALLIRADYPAAFVGRGLAFERKGNPTQARLENTRKRSGLRAWG